MLAVTEPTVSAQHDLHRVIDLTEHFKIPTAVCINKYDLNGDNTHQIENYCLDQGVEVAARIPFDNVITEALVQGLPVVEYSQGKLSQEIKRLWWTVAEVIGG